MRCQPLVIAALFAGGMLVELGCAARRVYALPATLAQTQFAAEPLLACAAQRNLRAERQGHDVQVNFDDRASTQFNLSRRAGPNMAISLSAGDMDATQTEAAFAGARRKSDDLLACATGAAPSTLPEAPHLQAAPRDRGAAMLASSLGDVAPLGDSCATLSSCYRDIASLMCNSTDTHCRANLSLRPGMQQADCEATLADMPQLALQLQAQRPNFAIPSACSSEQFAASGPAPVQNEAMRWTGTWTATVSYSWSCRDSRGSAPQPQGSQDMVYTLDIAGEPQALHAKSYAEGASTSLQGSATAAGLQLCGPLLTQRTASKLGAAPEQRVCLHIDRVETTDAAVGVVEGSFHNARGACQLRDARVQLRRQAP